MSAIEGAIRTPNRYPSLYADELAGDLAGRLDVGSDRVLVGPGSLALLESLLRSYVGPGDGVVYAWRSYEAYPNVLTAIGAHHQRVPLREDTHDLTAMAAAIDKRSRAVIVCNPNNPTGTVVDSDRLTAFLDTVQPSCLVVIDEAYREFVTPGATLDGVEAGRARPNVVTLRTFSKAFGLAGLRVGYIIGSREIVDTTRRLVPPFAVSDPADAAARSALAAANEFVAQVRSITRDRERLAGALRALKLPVPDCQANFVWLRLGAESEIFTTRLLTRGFNVRCFAGEGVRISIGDTFATSELIQAIRTM